MGQTMTLASIIREVLTKHVRGMTMQLMSAGIVCLTGETIGIEFRERNAGPAIDENMKMEGTE